MKTILIIVALFCSLKAQCQEDYIIHVNDTSYSVSLDKQYNLLVKGQKINFKITLKDTLTYNDSFYSFLYLNGVKVTKTRLDEGIEQIAILTAEGSGLLIQKYENINPTTLNEMMLGEITKESISYGFVSKRSNYKKALRSGHEIDVTKAVLTYKDDINIYEIASIGKKDAGVMILTIRMDNDNNTQGQKLIDLMWKSLKLNW